jgi:hypothetical protein
LGGKGAFSEAQWHNMRQQMQATRLNKAKRCELALHRPIGYERLPNGRHSIAGLSTLIISCNGSVTL